MKSAICSFLSIASLVNWAWGLTCPESIFCSTNQITSCQLSSGEPGLPGFHITNSTLGTLKQWKKMGFVGADGDYNTQKIECHYSSDPQNSLLGFVDYSGPGNPEIPTGVGIAWSQHPAPNESKWTCYEPTLLHPDPRAWPYDPSQCEIAEEK